MESEKDIMTRKKLKNEYVKVLRLVKAQHFSNKPSKLSNEVGVLQVIMNRDKSDGKIKLLDPITKDFISDEQLLCDILLKEVSKKLEFF